MHINLKVLLSFSSDLKEVRKRIKQLEEERSMEHIQLMQLQEDKETLSKEFHETKDKLLKSQAQQQEAHAIAASTKEKMVPVLNFSSHTKCLMQEADEKEHSEKLSKLKNFLNTTNK